MKKSFLFGLVALAIYAQNLVMPVWDYGANAGKGGYIWLTLDPATLEVVGKTLRVRSPQSVPAQGMIAWHVPEDLAGADLAPVSSWPNRANPSAPAASSADYACQVRVNAIGGYRGVQCGAAPTPCGPNCGFLKLPISYDIAQSTFIFVLRHNAPLSAQQNPLVSNAANNVTFGASGGPGGPGGQMQRYSWYTNQNGTQYGNGFSITTNTAPQIIGFSALVPRYVGAAYAAGEAQAKLFNSWLLAGRTSDPASFQGDGAIDYTSIPCFSWGDGSSNHVAQITQNKADDGVTPVLDPTGAGGCYATGDQTHPSDYGHAARATLEYNFYRSQNIPGFVN